MKAVKIKCSFNKIVISNSILNPTLLTLFVIVSIHHDCSAQDSTNSVNFETLKMTQLLFRHGDKEGDLVYPGGVGKLTDLGKKQLFEAGQFLRSRYGNDFLSPSYDPDQIYILSSDKDRTIQSAQMLTYGLYKEFNSRATWSKLHIDGQKDEDDGRRIPFEPIPIRTIPPQLDRYLLPEKGCVRRTEMNLAVRKEVGPAYFEEHKELIQYFIEHDGGEKAKGLLDESRDILDRDDDIHVLLQQLTYERIHNETLSPWMDRIYASESLFSFDLRIMRGLVSTLEGKRLHGGSFLKLLIDNMDAKVEGREDFKVKLFSGHDQTIQYLLSLLDLDDLSLQHQAPFASIFFVELHQTVYEEPFLKFLYRNDSKLAPFSMQVPGCPDPCTLQKFKELTSELIPKDFVKECQATGGSNLQKSTDTEQGPVLQTFWHNKDKEDGKSIDVNTTVKINNSATLVIVGGVCFLVLVASLVTTAVKFRNHKSGYTTV